MSILCKQVIGNLANFTRGTKSVDSITMEWFDAYKRIGRYKSKFGLDCIVKFDKAPPTGLSDGDILYVDSKQILYVEIQPSLCLLIKTQNLLEVAKLCYEIGNFHIPLFLFDNGNFCIPYERTMQKILQRLGFYAMEYETKLDSKYRLHTLNDNATFDMNEANTKNLALYDSTYPLVRISQDFNLSFSTKH